MGIRETNSLSASHSVNATFQVLPGNKHGAISHPQFDSHYNEPIQRRNEMGGMRRGCSCPNQLLWFWVGVPRGSLLSWKTRASIFRVCLLTDIQLTHGFYSTEKKQWNREQEISPSSRNCWNGHSGKQRPRTTNHSPRLVSSFPLNDAWAEKNWALNTIPSTTKENMLIIKIACWIISLRMMHVLAHLIFMTMWGPNNFLKSFFTDWKIRNRNEKWQSWTVDTRAPDLIYKSHALYCLR